MNLSHLRSNSHLIKNYLVSGIAVGVVYSWIEFYVRYETDDPQEYLPLLTRTIIAAGLITLSAAVFEILTKELFTQKRFYFLVVTRSLFYTLIITFWLSIMNGFWGMIDDGYTFFEAFIDYLEDPTYSVNLITLLVLMVILIGMRQINSLHRRGELWNFITGKYHVPMEIERIFCFIDLTGSTTIAEKLGHLKFGMFLKDYYSDITEAIKLSRAEIYQYVGDEIILSWSFENGVNNNHALNCFFMMQSIIHNLNDKYVKAYGYVPEFRAGMHGGKVLVTWVGEIKKEIVYIGDVINTTSRIQERSKRLSRDFLISEEVLKNFNDLGNIKASFIEEMIPRGKEQMVKLYSLEVMKKQASNK